MSGVEHAGSVPRQSWLDPSVRQLKSKLITPGRRVDDDGKGNDPPSEADIFSPSSTDKEIVERSSEAAGHTKSSGSFLTAIQVMVRTRTKIFRGELCAVIKYRKIKL